MADVFISHSSKDKETADKVVAYLEERGISCWIAPRNIVAGSDWAASISTAITSTKIFLLIYSENSSASEQVAREMNLAETVDEVFVVPYKIDETPLTGTYQYYLTGAHWIMADIKKNNYKLDELHLMISGILGKATQNITNNTYIDSVNIYSESSSAANTTGSGGRKKFIIAGIAGGTALVGIVVLLVILLAGNKEIIQKVETNTTSVTAETEPPGPTEGTLSSYKLICNNSIISGEYNGWLSEDGLPDGEGEFVGKDMTADTGNTVTVKGTFHKGDISGAATITVRQEDGMVVESHCDTFVKGKYNGTTTITFIKDGEFNCKSVAEYTDGKANGDGTEEYSYAEGYAQNALGYGIQSESFVGSYKNDKKNGKGTYTTEFYNGGKEVYEGEFADNTFCGKGKFTRYYPETSTDEKISTYEGEFRNGTMNGTGTHNIEYVSGESASYSGEFIDGYYDGEGTLTMNYVDSDKKTESYTGSFKQGYFDGKGKRVLEYVNGVKEYIEGDWEKGVTNGSVTYDCIYVEPKGDSKIVRELYSGNVRYNDRTGVAIQKIYLEDGTVISINGDWEDGIPLDGCTVTEQDKDGNLKRTGLYKEGVIEWQ